VWDLSQRHNKTWGIEGYEVPADHFDHAYEAKRKEYFDLNVGKKKKPKQKNIDMTIKKTNMFDNIAKRAASLPPPWQYDLPSLVNEKDSKYVPTKTAQIAKYEWLGVAKDDMAIAKPVKTKPKKVDTNLKKYTYVDWIIMQNTNQSYPKPGPDNYFMDLKTAKKHFKENVELFTKKEKDNTQKNKLA